MMELKKVCPQPISILMPVYNEAACIEEVIGEWVREVFRHLPEGSEFLLDEAASTDGTRDILKRLCLKHPFISVNYNDRRDGFGPAALRLYRAAKCPLVFFTDSDGQYVASEFWKLAPFAKEFSIVHGAKIMRQDSFFRKVASAMFNRISRFHFDIHYTDINSAFRMFKREALQQLLPTMKSMPTFVNAELLLRAELNNISIKQVRVLHRRRPYGLSRSLPTLQCFEESFKAYRGLLHLKNEFKNLA